jgi:hypothetical protein
VANNEFNLNSMGDIKHCHKCGEDKPFNDFFRDKSKKDGLCAMCKKCSYTYKKEYKIKNKDKIKKQAKTYRDKHPHRGVGQYRKYKEKRLIYGFNRRAKVKNEVLTYYGNERCACVRCGFTDLRALTIDHINGNGADHRKENRYVRGNHVYEWYQTLCMNCQMIKRSENHECSKNKKVGDAK